MVVRKRNITKQEIESNPKSLYLYGDNILRMGNGGLAKIMRGEPNCIGIRSKKKPSMEEGSFFTDREFENNKTLITIDINAVLMVYTNGNYDKIIIPPIGVGQAQLPQRAPKTWEWLQLELNRLEEGVNKYDKMKSL